MIPIYKPSLENYTESSIKAIKSHWISNHGKFIKLSTEELLRKIKSKFCILMNNGTSATHCLILSIKFKYPEIQKIYVPNNVFISPINCVLREYDQKKIEVMKLDKITLNICVEEEYIKSLEKNSAVLIVHNLGNIVNVSRLKRLRPDLIFVEDNCEGIFGSYEKHNTSSCKDVLCSSVSFYGNKTITTGEGGAFFTNDETIYNYITSIYSHSMTKEKYIHDGIGYNYRMTNVAAGLLYDQLRDLENILENKRRVFNLYLDNLKNTDEIILPATEENTKRSYWMFFLIFKNKKYSEVNKFLIKNGIESRPIFFPLSMHHHINIKIEENNDNFFINENGIILPSYPSLTEKEIKYICDTIKLSLDI